MKIKIISSSFVLFMSLLTPLVGLIPSASAVVDTCTWTGGGTGTVDSDLKTISFDVNDSANWNCSIDGVAVPEAGDTLEFPANLAEVDPLDSLTDDENWRYIVNNNLSAGTQFAGIQFTGDAGSYDCTANNDAYILQGNSIQLNGDVTSTINQCNRPAIELDVEALTDMTFGADLGYNSTLTYTTHAMTFDGGTLYNYIQGVLNGTGVINIGLSSFQPRDTSTIGDVVTVLSDSSLNISLPSVLNKSSMVITAQDGATVSVYSYNTDNNEFLASLVFVGDGAETSYSVSSDYTVQPVTVQGHRLNVSGSEYDFQTEKTTYYKITMSGNLTLSHNTKLILGSDFEVTGVVSGNYTLGIVPGSRGNLLLSSSDNQSATANGTIKRTRTNFALVDRAFDLYVGAGQDGILDPEEPITVRVILQDDARLQGTGEVAGLEVQAGATVAPGESPGCIASDGDLTLNGSYEFEIDTNTACTGYDQLDVTGAVDITGATLELSLIDGYEFSEDDEFVLIKNDGSDAVTGEFTGLEEGDEIEVDGNTFVISYEGGTGNDVSVLATSISANNAAAEEAEEAPGTPDTGVGSLISNPFAPLLSAMLAAGALIGVRKVNN